MDNMIKCKACDAENDQKSTFCIYCGETLVKEQETQEIKTKKTSKIVMISLIVILLGLGIGFIAYKVINLEKKSTVTYKDDYELNTLLMIKYEEDKDSKSANLYFQKEGEEEQLVAKKVDFDRYIFAPKTNQVAYVDEEYTLYVAKLGGEPIQIAKQVDSGYICFTPDEENIIFCANKNESSITYIYNIKEDSKEKLDDSGYAYLSHEYDEQTKTIYFVDENHGFYRYNKVVGKEKIRKDVTRFKVLSDSLFAFENIRNEKREYSIYNEQSEEEEELDFEYIDMAVVSTLDNPDILLFSGNEKGDEFNLYIKIKGQEPIEFQSEISMYQYTPGMDVIYYVNEDNMLYAASIPSFSKKALQDHVMAEDLINEVEKEKLLSNILTCDMSADGKKVVAQSKDNELTLLINREKLKIDDDVIKYDVFNDYIVYLNKENELYVQKDINVSDISKITSKPEQIAENVKDEYYATEYGKYVIYIEEKGEKDPTYQFMRYSEGGNIKVMLDNLDQYDAVAFNNMKHVRSLKYSDIVGKYSCEEFEFVMELDKDNKLSIYNTGTKKADLKISTVPLSIYEVEINPEEEQDITLNTYVDYEASWVMMLDENMIFTKGSEGTYTLATADGVYGLELITDEEFNQAIERQKEAEEERLRIEEERRKAEEERLRAEEEERQRILQLENLASQYYYQGVYLPSGTYVYDTPDFGSMTTYYTNSARTWTVSDYYIDYDASVIWVEIIHDSVYGYGSDYSWVPMY